MGEERIRIESYNMNEGKQTTHAHKHYTNMPFFITNHINDFM
jgi:hypothetical protein